MKEQILDLIKDISEEDQNILITELALALKQQRLTKAMELEREANRLRCTLNSL
jgi:hypothetical protein